MDCSYAYTSTYIPYTCIIHIDVLVSYIKVDVMLRSSRNLSYHNH